MKKIISIILGIQLLLSPFMFSEVHAQQVSDFNGYYELNHNDSLLKGIEIQDYSFSLVINNENIYNEGSEDPYVQILLDWYNVYMNSASADGTIDPEAGDGDNNNVELHYLMIDFARGIFPSFQLEIINPIYELEDNVLTVKYKHHLNYTFEQLENGNLIDPIGNEFILSE